MRMNAIMFLALAAVALSAGERNHTLSRKTNMPYTPYDGHGRYTMDKGAETPKRYQHLLTVKKRYGYKPYKELWQGDHWQTERMVFHDSSTGARIVRLTNDYGSDYLDYHKGAWSADGKYLVWRRKPGMWESSTETNGPTCARSDGNMLRPVFRDAPGSRLVRKYQASRIDPDVCFSMVGDKKLCAFSFSTGKYLRTLGTPGGSWHLKSSIDGKYLLSYMRKDGERYLWVMPHDAADEEDGNKRTKWVTVSKSIHDSYYIHPTQPYVMFWYEGDYRTEGFRQKRFDNTDEKPTGIKYDWNHGDFGLKGKCVHESGKVYTYEGTQWTQSSKTSYAKGGEEYYDVPHSYNGYSSYMPKDGDWVVGSRLTFAPYVSELQMHAVDPIPQDRVNRFRLCLIGNYRGGALDAVDGSPDGTKFAFNSDMFDANQIFYVVARNPEPPRNLRSEGKTLLWQPAAHHAETAGYIVYWSKTSGGPYKQISDQLSTTRFEHKGRPGHYVVTAIEHSGLESGYSTEASPNWGNAIRVHVEADRGTWDTAIWKCFHDEASDLYYVWQRKSGTSQLGLDVTVPKSGDYYVWARVKGNGTWAVSGQSLAVSTPSWSWIRTGGQIALKAGQSKLELTGNSKGLCLDSLWLATDDTFKPSGKGPEDQHAPAPVTDLRGEGLGLHTARLKWKAGKDKDIAHYNLYVSSKGKFQCDRETLIASPIRPQYLDWQLRPNRAHYYRVTAVDRRGNESEPSTAVCIWTTRAAPEKIEADIAMNKEITIDVQRDGKFCVWVHASDPSRIIGYLDIIVDGKKTTWSPRHSSLVSKDVWLSYGQFGVIDLKKGKHTFQAAKGKFKVDKLILTSDLSWKPKGYTRTSCSW